MIKRIVFCDFDGTITTVDTFVEMVSEFAPDLSAKILPELFARNINLKVAVRQLLQSIPAKIYPDMIAFSDGFPIRNGLEEFLEFLEEEKIQCIVVSGGLKDIVKRVLTRKLKGNKPLIERVTAIFAMNIDLTQEYLVVPNQEFEGETELVAKAEVMKQYKAQETIAIGDSLTDLNIARKADLVFARDKLSKYLDLENKPYQPWNDFFDIISIIIHLPHVEL